MKNPISISAIASVSALGAASQNIWQQYLKGSALFVDSDGSKVSQITTEIENEIEILRQHEVRYKRLDRSVLLALLAARKAVSSSSELGNKRVGINIGSSRGATSLFEKFHQDFQKNGKVSPFTSPTTTLGNISSWVGQDLGVSGVQIEHSVTCSTAMHAILNGIAWLKSDMADAFLVGGSEAALTPFTVAQMKALKLYTTSKNDLACESMRFQKKKNTMVLGEGAAVALLEKGVSEKTQVVITGYGFASEILEHPSAISEQADCFQNSMQQALENAELSTVDAIVMHAPGTVKGDLAEKKAIDLVFGKQLPLLTSNKWLVGHTFATSGMLSVEMAMLMLQHNKLVENPFYGNSRHLPPQLKTILINAVGFGGNAVSIILQKPELN
ncbi:beta-ketoacyl synthase [Rasiella rasia]|uniref:Beta-ketoacyl synthase n=1 Tax=Rasiella rasia TaxID=2744027 RepID=A0A6G6GLY5_9FLAO|nr:beta-ketoacyl synthase N-terminal-like domain-containing protein [Rasiella rasia]QIE59558.1 beta-ketoacyl synthase [Rasiella rasia]